MVDLQRDQKPVDCRGRGAFGGASLAEKEYDFVPIFHVRGAIS